MLTFIYAKFISIVAKLVSEIAIIIIVCCVMLEIDECQFVLCKCSCWCHYRTAVVIVSNLVVVPGIVERCIAVDESFVESCEIVLVIVSIIIMLIVMCVVVGIIVIPKTL